MNDVPEKNCGWIKPWHPKGLQVTLPIIADYDYAAAFKAVSASLDAGFLVAAPGLEEGEEKEEVGWVCRGAFEKEGEVTPYVLLYAVNEQLTWSFLKVYLNKPQDIAAFEYASKLQFDKLPDYVGNDKPQRGASKKTDAFIVKVPKPFTVVYKRNPKHNDTEEGKMKPARLFVRWSDTKPDGAQGKPEESAAMSEHTQQSPPKQNGHEPIKDGVDFSTRITRADTLGSKASYWPAGALVAELRQLRPGMPKELTAWPQAEWENCMAWARKEFARHREMAVTTSGPDRPF